jgi:hypothetical protein
MQKVEDSGAKGWKFVVENAEDSACKMLGFRVQK